MVCAITAARFDVDGRRITLNRFDSLRVATPNLPIVAATDAVAYAIELQERAA
jgi:hypothetical protein